VTEVTADDRIRVVHLGYPKTAEEFLRREIWHGMGAVSRSGVVHRNKPLIGAVAFTVLLILLALGLAAWAAGRAPDLAVGAVAALTILLVSSAAYRLGRFSPPVRLAQVSLLCFLYYLGRAIAIPVASVRRLSRQGHAHRVR
jgi:predicted transporter